MHGFCGILGNDDGFIDEFRFLKSINLAETMKTQVVSAKSLFSAVSFLESAPLKGNHFYKTSDLIILFAGDLIEYKEIPWSNIEDNILISNFKWFSTLEGSYAFVIFDLKKNQLFLISDQRAQIPIYYGSFGENFIFSTDLSTFTTLKIVPDFNVEYLYEYLFFNFPIDRTTCFKNVNRLRPLTILNFDCNSISEYRYGEILKIPKKILTGKTALKKCIKAFKKRVPKYFDKCNSNLVAITAGFDTRTLLALAPKESELKCYTYGVPGSSDLSVASKLLKKIQLNHQEILFDNKFENKLPNLIYETVRLSGGVQSILRSTLPYVYRSLSKSNEDISIIIGGIGGDLFRGYGNAINNAIVSPGMRHFFRTGETLIDKELSKQMFDDAKMFEDHIQLTLNKMKDLYGDPLDLSTPMSFENYEVNSKYFGGEEAIASNYFTFRQPFWDMELLRLAFQTEFGNIGFTGYRKRKKNILFKKYELQSKIINDNLKLKKTLINGMPIFFYAQGNKLLFQLSKLFIRGFARIKGEKSPHDRLEDWDNWFNNILNKEFDKLLNKDSLICQYINYKYILFIKASKNIESLSKLVTTEILLKLIKNRWDIISRPK